MSARHKLQKCKDIWVRRPNTEAADVGLECRLPVTRKRSSKASSNIYARRCLVFDEERSLIDRESHGQTALMRNVVYSIKKNYQCTSVPSLQNVLSSLAISGTKLRSSVVIFL